MRLVSYFDYRWALKVQLTLPRGCCAGPMDVNTSAWLSLEAQAIADSIRDVDLPVHEQLWEVVKRSVSTGFGCAEVLLALEEHLDRLATTAGVSPDEPLLRLHAAVALRGASVRTGRAAMVLIDRGLVRCRSPKIRGLLQKAIEKRVVRWHENDRWPDVDAKPSIPLALVACPAWPLVSRKGCANWDAISKWASPSYWRTRFGDRTIPIEVGEMYNLDGRQQRLISINDYVDKVILSSDLDPTSLPPTAPSPIVPVTSASTRAYLAQHPIFDQIPDLLQDLVIEDLSPCASHTLNIWFAPAGVATPAHFDARDNYLAHLVGYKVFLLWHPSSTPAFKPSEPPLDNTATVDISALLADDMDCSAFPTPMVVLLEPGDVLFIPAGFWHFALALTTSISVSCWVNQPSFPQHDVPATVSSSWSASLPPRSMVRGSPISADPECY